ncbi:COG4705 family protein [Leptospirillum ferriphilum]|jgi:uncharacterized membrane-anchored protein|uniref:COG4705 family protein n=1 Tax=Leptospirillum ferriphilum TaxID=178606 RepID=UPI003EE7277E
MQYQRREDAERFLSKVPEVTLVFWIVKIAATTLGETGGDAVTMSMHLGYLVGTLLFSAVAVMTLFLQIRSRRFHPILYWSAIVSTTTVGTTLADLLDRSLEFGYARGSMVLFSLLLGVLAIWYWRLGSISVASVSSASVEVFYWTAILFSQTLGTAVGDLVSGLNGFGYGGGSVVFLLALLLLAALFRWTDADRTLLFWLAFVLTRPLGAAAGDLLDKPRTDGGFGLDRFLVSGVLVVFILVLVVTVPQKAVESSRQSEEMS